MKTLHFTLEQARNFLVTYHFLNQRSKLSGDEGIKSVFNRLGSIQYDPLNVVGKNSDLVLQSRINDFTPAMLDDALYKKRYLIDGWDKQMCVYQLEDFPYFKRVRDARAQAHIDGFYKYFKFDLTPFIEPTLNVIKEGGPMFSSQIKIGEKMNSYWGNAKPSNAALDYLFHKGIIGITERRNTQKKYDLIDNIFGDIVKTEDPFDNDDQAIRWFILRRIKSLGLVWKKSSVFWSGLHIQNKKVRDVYLETLFEEGKIAKVKIENYNDDFFIPTDFIMENNPINKASIIGPLDNFIWDRELTLKLFDFDYKWEVYTPKSKRKYGYYVLPVLFNNKFIGRIEFEKQRKKEPLIIINFWWEKGEKPLKKYIDAVEKCLEDFRNYLGASEIIGLEVVKKPNYIV